ncbi:hypothetical protein HN011_007033 [Eciton burchellii]|nr:hypothetical protein HN011_007033 [Eciton burchellii]
MVAERAAPSHRVNPGWFHDLVGLHPQLVNIAHATGPLDPACATLLSVVARHRGGAVGTRGRRNAGPVESGKSSSADASLAKEPRAFAIIRYCSEYSRLLQGRRTVARSRARGTSLIAANHVDTNVEHLVTEGGSEVTTEDRTKRTVWYVLSRVRVR